MSEHKPRYNVVGRERGRAYEPQERHLDISRGNDIDAPAGATLVPIKDQPRTQVRLLETDDHDEALEYVKSYQGDLIGVKVIDSRINPRP